MDPTKIIMYPLMTEKCIDSAGKENKVTFIVSIKSKKNEIRDAVEKLYKVKVASVNTQITMKGIKKATVMLKKDYSAEDIISSTGVL